jgi:hypothetical protein
VNSQVSDMILVPGYLAFWSVKKQASFFSFLTNKHMRRFILTQRKDATITLKMPKYLKIINYKGQLKNFTANPAVAVSWQFITRNKLSCILQ